MARLFSSGFECGAPAGGKEWGSASGNSVVTTNKRTGTYCCLISPNATRKYVYTQMSGTVGKGLFGRIYFRLGQAPSAANTIFGFSRTSVPTCQVRIVVNTDRTLALFDEAGQIGTSSSALSTGVYHCIELHSDTTNASGSMTVEARLNGVTFATTTTATIGGTLTYIVIGSNLNSETDNGGSNYFDDVGLNDQNGSEQNSWCGEGSIIHLRPSAAGDSSDWQRGGTDSGSNWGQVDEVNFNDSTDYVKSTGTLNETDDYNVTDVSLSGQVIRFVQVGHRGNLDVTGGTYDKIKLRIKASSGGTVQESDETYNTATTWRTHFSAVVSQYKLTAYFQPSTSTRWTEATLNSLQIGYRVSTTGTNHQQTTTIWALVEYRPILLSTLIEPVVLVQGLSRLLTLRSLIEVVIILDQAIKRQITRTLTDIVVVVGNILRGYYQLCSAIVVIVPTYSDLFQAGRLFTERILVIPTLLRRIWASIWSKVGRTNSSYTGIDKPHC